jgi:hypothetical protein
MTGEINYRDDDTGRIGEWLTIGNHERKRNAKIRLVGIMKEKDSR